VCQWRSVQKYTDHQDQRTFLPCLVDFVSMMMLIVDSIYDCVLIMSTID